uniref:TOG domain-containing protein n=1 Tax=Panagrolaimus sp. ES5 TaxID=591445 RepID=A0AC34FD49_9BILA
MATKKDYLSFNDKQNSFIDATSNGQYKNLNLNQNYRDFLKDFISFKSVKTDSRKDENYDFYESQTKNDSKSKNKSSKNLSSSFLNFTCESGEEHEFKKTKSANNSTLSLHISAYENLVEAAADSDGVEKEEGLKRKCEKSSLAKKLKNSEQLLPDFPSILQNFFEFPRQQEEKDIKDPEIAQFKASQKLLNPNTVSETGQSTSDPASGNSKLAPNQKTSKPDEKLPLACTKKMSNGWDFADPVDILSKLPKNFQELIASKKWQERKEALELLQNLATENVRLDPTTSYKEIVQTLSKILAKDSNINVCATAAKCIAQLAKGLRTNFAPYVPNVTSVIFEKFKEKKSTLRDPLIEAIDAVYASTNIDAMCDDVAVAIVKQNPNIKIQTNQFLHRVFKACVEVPPKKAIKTLTPLIVKCTGESDAEVREAAYSALGAIMNLIGKSNAMSLLGEISNDKTKMEQVEKFYAQVQAEVAEQKQQNAEIGGGQGEGGASAEDLIKLQNINTKLIAEKGELKTKLDKTLVDYKKVSQELAKALQKITQMEAETKQIQTRNTTLQQQLATATKKSETLERQLASRPRAPAGTPTTNGISRPATTPIQSRSNSGLTLTGSRSVTSTITTSTAAKPISRRSVAPMASSSASKPSAPVKSTSTTGLRLPSRAGSQTSIPISAAVQKAVASGSRLPVAPR